MVYYTRYDAFKIREILRDSGCDDQKGKLSKSQSTFLDVNYHLDR